MEKKRFKIFMGLAETSGYYSNLKKGFLEIGQESVFIDLGYNKHRYCGDDVPNLLVKLYKKIFFFREKIVSPNFVIKIFFKVIMLFLKLLIFIWAVISFDVFIFSGSSSFFQYWDYPILKFFRKKIIKIHLGSGSRPPFLDGAVTHGGYTGYKPTTDELIELTKMRKQELVWMDKYIDIIIDHPPQAYFHEKKFISVLFLGIPFSTEKFKIINCDNSIENETVRILHAPSYMGHKGTAEIRNIINELKNEGYNIEYTEISNMPNELVLKEIQKCDFVVDELYSDTPMATLAAEAAFFGKPAIVGGYFFEHLSYYYKDFAIPPTVHCHPSRIKDEIIYLICDKNNRKKVGMAARKYVLNIWTPRVVALKYMSIINNTLPQKWFFNPYEIEYINGYGMSEVFLKNILKDMVDKKGIKSLQLSDKPKLKTLFNDFINSRFKSE